MTKPRRLEMTLPVPVLPKQSANFARGKAYAKGKTKANAFRLQAYVLIKKPAKFRPFQGPVKASYVFSYPWRANEPQKNRKNGSMPKCTSPDIDNLCKQMGDVLEECGVFAQGDGQISTLTASKVWSDEGPCVWFRVEQA